MKLLEAIALPVVCGFKTQVTGFVKTVGSRRANVAENLLT